jgi:hypothetical protein
MILFERLEREDDILRRHRLAVVPLRLRPQPVGDRRKILRVADRFGQQPVFGRNLVERLDGQRFVDQPDRAGDRALYACDSDIEIVKGANRDLPHRAALRRFRIDVVEPLEVGRIFDVAEERQAVPPHRLAGRLGLGRFG